MENYPRDSKEMRHLRNVWLGMHSGLGKKWGSVGELAMAAGLASTTLYDWRKGNKQADVETLLALSKLTGANFLVLMWLSGYFPVEEVWDLLPEALKAPMEREDLIEKT